MKKEELESLVETSLQGRDKAEEYLKSRSLNYFGSVGYVPFFQIDGNTIMDSLVIPVYSYDKQIILVETRPLTGPKNSYRKFRNPESLNLPLYNANDISDWKIVTEGILNAECLNQIEGISAPAVATLTASFSFRVMHYLAASVDTGLLLALDNDPSGLGTAKKSLEFFSEFYPFLKVQVLDFPYGDLNDFLVKKGSSTFKRHMLSQIRMGMV